MVAVATAASTGGPAWAAEGSSAVPAGPLGALVPAAAETEEGGCLPLTDDQPDGDDVDGALGVLIDGTASSTGQSDRIEDLVTLVDDTTADRTVAVSVGSFGGSDAEVRFSSCLDGDVFVPDGNNARTRARNRPDLLDGLTDLLTGLPGGYETSDPTSALRAGVDRLAAGPGPRVLVIHTDGIPTTGCAALADEVDVAEPGLIDRLLDSCQDAGHLPTANGVDIVIGGIGRTDSDLSAEAVTFLLELNLALCEATGATCQVAANLPTDVWPSTEEE